MQYQGNQLYKPIEPYQSAFDTYKYHSNPRAGMAEDSYGDGVYWMMGHPPTNGQQWLLGTNVLALKNVSLKLGDKIILDNFSYEFCGGDKIGICGANGVGKSTFIKVINSGQQPIDSGEIVQGETVIMGV